MASLKSTGPIVAVLGTGIIGGHMAARLAEAGLVTRLWNRTAAKAEAVRGGLRTESRSKCSVHGCPEEAVEGADVVLTALSDGPATESVLLGAAGTAALPIRRGAAVVCVSSIAPGEATRVRDGLAALGVALLDAPVSGGEQGARDGALAIMAGCDTEAVPGPVSEVLAHLGRTTVVGAVGAGSLAKLLNQAIVAAQATAVAEAFRVARASGMDVDAVPAALRGGFADSAVLQQHWPRMARGDYRPGGPAKHLLKDLANLERHASEAACGMPVVAAARRRVAELVGATASVPSGSAGEMGASLLDGGGEEAGSAAGGGDRVRGGDLDISALALL